jgi:large subunit ribosomal protein L3
MAGHWGDERVSVQNLQIVEVRPEENLLLIKGSVPGAQRSVVIIKRASKPRKKTQAPADEKAKKEK